MSTVTLASGTTLSELIPSLPEGGIEFAQPAWLVLIPVLWAVLWWIASGAIGGWRGGRQSVYLVLRALVVAMICVAMAEPSVRWAARDVSVVVVRDVSRSVPDDQQRAADAFIDASLARKRPGDRIGVLTTAREAFVQSLPSPFGGRPEHGFVGRTDATDLREALMLARGLIPADSAGRILLVSDGNPTQGDINEAVRAAAAAAIPIDVAPVEYDRGDMISVERVVTPEWARENDAILARVVIHAGWPVSGRMSVFHNGRPVDLHPDPAERAAEVALEPGVNTLDVPVTLAGASSHRIEVYFEPEDGGPHGRDPPELLRAAGVTFTSARGRVLVVTEDEEALRAFLDAIGSEEVVVETTRALSMPRSLIELAGYDAVVLADQPASNFDQAQQEDLVRYVRDTGGGLLVIGGPQSYGAGAWIGSRVAEALPVLLDPPQKRQMPKGALAIVIDRSGSMSAPVSGTGLSQQRVANEAAILGVQALSRFDEVAVIAFTGDYDIVVPLTVCSDPADIARRIRAIGPGGGTNLFPALDAAGKELAKSEGGVKHIIVLSDGQTIGEPGVGLGLARQLRSAGVSVSTVAIGDGHNDTLLKGMAALGGGNAYTVSSSASMAQLPQIFIKEAQTVRRSLIWEGEAFSPKFGAPGESMRGLSDALPGVTGYVVTADRGGLATVLLRGPEEDPVLAQWQHGLGRVTAFMSDASSRWNADWIGWGSFAAFWRQQIEWTMRPAGDPGARVVVEPQSDRTRVVVELFDDDGERVSFADLSGRVMRADSTGLLDDTPRPIEWRQAGPGRYEGFVETPEAGVNMVSVGYSVPDGGGGERRGTVRAAIVRSAGDELRSASPDTALLWETARQTRGRIYALDPAGADLWGREHLRMPMFNRPIWLVIALSAIGLFLVDVAARRVSIDLQRARAWAVGLVIPAAAKRRRPESLRTLSDAKARAVRSMERPPMAARDAEGGAPARVTEDLRASMTIVAPAAGTREDKDPRWADRPEAASGDDGSDADTISRLRAAKRRAREE